MLHAVAVFCAKTAYLLFTYIFQHIMGFWGFGTVVNVQGRMEEESIKMQMAIQPRQHERRRIQVDDRDSSQSES